MTKKTVATTAPEVSELPQDKQCIFCRGYADSGKYINQRVVPLCTDHYQTMKLGQIAARLRDIDGTTRTN